MSLRALLSPSLQSLVISVAGTWDSNATPSSSDYMLEKILGNIPTMAINIVSLRLDGVPHWQSITPISGLTRVRSLSLEFSLVTKSISDVLSTLASIPHLSELTIRCHDTFLLGQQEATSRTFSMSSLCELDVHGNVQHMVPFLSNLSLPRLESLRLVLDAETVRDLVPPTRFPSCLERLKLAEAAPDLQELTLVEGMGECRFRRKQKTKLSLYDLVQPLLALKGLRSFNLWRSTLCSGISNDAIRCISESFPYLRTLGLYIENASGDRPSLRALN